MTRFQFLDVITQPTLYILPLAIAERAWRRQHLHDRWVFVIAALGGLTTALLLNGATLLAWLTLGSQRGEFPVGEWRRELAIVREGLIVGISVGLVALVVRGVARDRQASRTPTGGLES